jgi:hypothetical protein
MPRKRGSKTKKPPALIEGLDEQRSVKLHPRYVLGSWSPDSPFESDSPLDEPTSKLDIEIMEAAKSRIDAMDSDFRLLAKRLRKEAGRKRDGRDILADYLEGKLRQPAHRPQRIRPKLAQQLVADFVRAAKKDHLPWSEIIKLAKKQFGVSERYVYDADKNYNENAEILRARRTARKSDLTPPK